MRAVTCERLELTGLMKPVRPEILFGDRVAVLGSQRIREVALPAPAAPVAARGRALGGRARLGARVGAPGYFAQTHEHPELVGRTLLEILLWRGADDRPGLDRGRAMAVLRRYGLEQPRDQPSRRCRAASRPASRSCCSSCGRDAAAARRADRQPRRRVGAEALEQGLAGFEGTVLAVTHDRWFARSFDRFLVFGESGDVVATDVPVWDAGFVRRAR